MLMMTQMTTTTTTTTTTCLSTRLTVGLWITVDVLQARRQEGPTHNSTTERRENVNDHVYNKVALTATHTNNNTTPNKGSTVRSVDNQDDDNDRHKHDDKTTWKRDATDDEEDG